MLEAYSVAVRLRLVDSVSAGLMGMAAQFAAFNRHVNTSQTNLRALEGQLQRIKLMGFLGGAAMAVGGVGLLSLKAPLEEAAKWTQEATRFASLGFGQRVNQDAQQFALGMKTYGTSARDNLALLSDSMAVFKNLHDAQIAAPILAKMKFGNEAVFGEGGAANESKFMDMLKVIEMRRGLSSPAEFATQANFVQKVIAGSRGRVDASQMLQALKTGGVALSNMGNDAFYLGSEGLIQEFGGQRYGTAMMSIYQNLVQGRTTSAAAAELVRLGLIDKHGIVFNSLGGVKKFQPGSFKGTGLFSEGRQNPVTLLNEVLLPAFAAKGITSESDVLLELGRILTNRTGSALLSRAFQQRPTLLNQWSANRNAMDVNQLEAAAENTPIGKQINLHKKYMDLLRELGIAALPIFTKAVAGLTSVLKAGVSFARAWPTLTKGLVVAFMGLSALMVAGGAVTLITAGFRGLGLALAIGRGVGLGSQLISVAGGLSSIATVAARFAGIAGLVAAAGGVGYLIGDTINKAGPKGDLGGWLGGKLYEFMNPYDPNKTVVHVHNKIDKHGITTMVTQGQAKASHRPQTGLTLFDSRMSVAPAGGY